jgi:Ala-tRNA(Pro) deacylase
LVAKVGIFGKLKYMKIPQKIIKYLDKAKIKYETIEHKTVFTAYDKAATLKIKPNLIGKTLVLKADKDLIMVLVPGNKNLDLVKLKKLAKAKKVDFISETIIKNKFKGVKLGAIPPFGELWKLPMFVDRGLAKEKNIFVSSGIYEASFKLSTRIFEKLGAILGNFSKAKGKK